MSVQVRVREKDSLARFLGWFSLGLGTAQVVAPRALCLAVGASGNGRGPALMRLLGVRELTQGVGILVRPRPTTWLWSRVAGDALDLSLLAVTGIKHRRVRTVFAAANVLAVTVPDVYESRFLSRRSGPARSGVLIRKGVTINRPRPEVEDAWAEAWELRRKVENRDASVAFADAPGDRGTEVVVEFLYDPPAGDLGAAVQKLAGKDLATQLSDDLRRFKQHVETGEIARSEGVPEGELAERKFKQRPAQPLEDSELEKAGA